MTIFQSFARRKLPASSPVVRIERIDLHLRGYHIVESEHHMNPGTDNLATRASLLSKVKKGEAEAWSEFFSIYRKFIYGLARRGGLSHEDAEDLTLETMVKVSEHLNRFTPDKSRARFRTWLRAVVRNKLIDHSRKTRRLPERRLPSVDSEPDRSLRTSTIERLADPNSPDFEMLSEEEWQRAILEAATNRVKAKVNIKHFQIYDLYELRQMPAAEVAESVGVFVAQVYLVAYRVKKAVKREALRLRSSEPSAPGQA